MRAELEKKIEQSVRLLKSIGEAPERGLNTRRR